MRRTLCGGVGGASRALAPEVRTTLEWEGAARALFSEVRTTRRGGVGSFYLFGGLFFESSHDVVMVVLTSEVQGRLAVLRRHSTAVSDLSLSGKDDVGGLFSV